MYHFQAGGRAPDGAPKWYMRNVPEKGLRDGKSLSPSGIWLVGQAVKTPASHAGNAGSIPARVTKDRKEKEKIENDAYLRTKVR